MSLKGKPTEQVEMEKIIQISAVYDESEGDTLVYGLSTAGKLYRFSHTLKRFVPLST